MPEPQSVHIFDVDYTLIKSSTTFYFLAQGLREGIFSPWQVARLPYEWAKYKLGLVDPDFIAKAVAQIAGIEQTRLEDLASRVFETRVKRNIFLGAANLIKELMSRGEKVCFATSSFLTLVQPLADFLGVRDIIASSLEFENGKTTGRIAGEAAFGHGKKDAAVLWLSQHSVPLGAVTFYTDSYSDIPLLELCGNPVAVNPDLFLLRKAKKHGWRVIRFKETIYPRLSAPA